MTQGKTFVITLVALAMGFIAGFVLRPILAPTVQTVATPDPARAATMVTETRATQYFASHVDEARQVVAGCRDGSVRGGECANAEEAIIKIDAHERQKRFLGN